MRANVQTVTPSQFLCTGRTLVAQIRHSNYSFAALSLHQGTSHIFLVSEILARPEVCPARTLHRTWGK